MLKIKKCVTCNKLLENTNEFFSYVNKNESGLRSECKACNKISYKKYYEKNSALIQAKRKAIKYNIDIKHYDELYKKQGGRCLICNIDSEVLDVDHDHKTGEVRGLLCRSCNLGLGHFKDNKESLKKALEYLS